MNYITLINNFWERQSVKPVSSGAVALFFALLNQANKRHWQFPVHLTNIFLQEQIHISRNAFYRCRNELKDNGYISYEGINNYIGSAYFVEIGDKKSSTQQGTHQGTQQSTQQGTQQSTAEDTSLPLSSYNNKTKKENINKDFKQKYFNKNNDKEIYDSGRYDFERIQRVARKRIREYLAEE